MQARADAVSRTRRALVRHATERLRASAEPITLVEVAAAAGVSRTTLYRHFPSPTSLLDAVAADLLSRANFDRLIAAVDLPDPVAALAQVTALGCAIWEIDPPLVRNLISLARAQADAVPVIDELERGRERIMQQLVSRLEANDALAETVSPREAVDMLLVATNFAGWDQLVTGRRRSPRAATRLIVRLVMRSVTTSTSGVAR